MESESNMVVIAYRPPWVVLIDTQTKKELMILPSHLLEVALKVARATLPDSDWRIGYCKLDQYWSILPTSYWAPGFINTTGNALQFPYDASDLHEDVYLTIEIAGHEITLNRGHVLMLLAYAKESIVASALQARSLTHMN